MKGQNSFNIFWRQFFDPLPQLTTPNVKGEQQENGHILAAFESLPMQSMLDFILLEKEDLESATTIDDGKLTLIEIRKLLKAKEWFIT